WRVSCAPVPFRTARVTRHVTRSALPGLVAMTDLRAALASVDHALVDGFDAIRLTAGSLDAAFVPQVGMAGASLCHQGDELLSRETGLDAYLATGAVMGIPLLHPWANRLDREDYEAAGVAVRLPRRLPRDD